MAQADFSFSTAYLGTPSYGSAVAHATLTNPLTSAAEQNCRYWADDGSGNRLSLKGLFAKCEKVGGVSVADSYAISLRGWFRVPAATSNTTVLGLRAKGSSSSGVSGYNFYIYQNKLYSELSADGTAGVLIDGDLVLAAAADQWHRLRMDVIPVMHEGSVIMDRVRFFTWNADTSLWTLRGERYYEATDTDFLPWGDATYKYSGFFLHNAQSAGLASYASGYVDDFEVRLEATATSARGVSPITVPEAPPVSPLTLVDEVVPFFGRSVHEFANSFAFAALKSDGSVVTWGDFSKGGSSTAVAADLSSGVQQVYSTTSAFAALKQDGTVVCWGDSASGGTAPAGLTGVSEIYSTSVAFAALKDDGSVVTWGNTTRGGDSSAVAASLASGVVDVFSHTFAFAALKDDGSVVAWGGSAQGGTGVPSEIQNAVKVRGTDYAFCALEADGTIWTWGSSVYGGARPAQPTGISEVYSNSYAFTAVKTDNTAFSWGFGNYGGTSPAGLSNVDTVVSNLRAFAALRTDGSVVAWGYNLQNDAAYSVLDGATATGDSSALLQALSSGVVEIYANDQAFAALKSDGSVVTWGQNADGGDSSAVSAQLASGVVEIFSTQRAFAALKSDGSLVVWGNAAYGADAASVDLSSGVVRVFGNADSFAAIKDDGSLVAWGNAVPTAGVAASLASDVLYISTPRTADTFTG